MIKTLPFARYRFEFLVTQSVSLPDDAGWMLRNAFGQSLRQLACLKCEGCSPKNSCAFTEVFAPSAGKSEVEKTSPAPLPYIIEPSRWGHGEIQAGNTLSLSMVLMGPALDHLPLIIQSWKRTLKLGVGTGGGTAELIRVVHCGENPSIEDSEIYRAEEGLILPHKQTINISDGKGIDVCPENITLRFTTPLCIESDGHVLPLEKLEAHILLRAIVERVGLVFEYYTETSIPDWTSLMARNAVPHDSKNLHWVEWARYSTRQEQKPNLGGALGDWTLCGELADFLPYLKLGEWLHVGKGAAFGQGKYVLVPSLL